MRRCTEGFSLIEAVVAIAIMAILASAALPLLMKSVNQQAEQTTRANAQIAYNAIFGARDHRVSNLIADFGANVTSTLLSWIEQSQIAELLADDGVSLDVVVVTTAHPDSVGDALGILQRLDALTAPTLRLFLVLNCAAGDFDSYADSAEQEAFGEMVSAGTLTIVEVPRCGSEIWRDCERHRITPLHASTMSPDALSEMLRTPRLETRRGRGELAKWHRDVIDAFLTAELLPRDTAVVQEA